MKRGTWGGVSACVALTIACTTLTEELPTHPSVPSGSPSPVSSPVVVVPIPLPSPVSVPSPTPTPAPSASPTPSPTPAPSTPPATGSCNLPAGSGSGSNCPRESPTFLSQMESATDQLIRDQPQIFNMKKASGCETCYQILDFDAYSRGMIQRLNQRGLCAVDDGEEYAVKNTNQFNDQYDRVTSDGFVRRQLGSYRTTCYPAWF